ncbi:4Fe-4S binding protein [Methanosarcina sp. Mfa9]|uniref:ATP-binding protein n=1 Tax=Methanosarcina sp. Mfa9 TaxID=3439063 RepID=UPI003F82B463
MKQLAIISGKGGSGKTTLTAAFASLAKNAVIADCDVDAADMHLILKPEIQDEDDYLGLEVASIDPELCTGCGKCREVCRFGAISADITINQYSCEGCAVCTVACPENAVSMKPRISGQVFSSKTRFGPLAHAKLGIGEEASGKLVSAARERATKLAEQYTKDLIIIDGPPGIGCPVIAAITGTDLVLAVSEPTVSGIHDLKRVIELAKHFRIPAAVCINKCDINEENSLKIEEFCAEAGVPVLGRLPYDDITTRAMMREETVIEYAAREGSLSNENSPCLENSPGHEESVKGRDFTSKVRKIWEGLEEQLSEVSFKGPEMASFK